MLAYSVICWLMLVVIIYEMLLVEKCNTDELSRLQFNRKSLEKASKQIVLDQKFRRRSELFKVGWRSLLIFSVHFLRERILQPQYASLK